MQRQRQCPLRHPLSLNLSKTESRESRRGIGVTVQVEQALLVCKVSFPKLRSRQIRSQKSGRRTSLPRCPCKATVALRKPLLGPRKSSVSPCSQPETTNTQVRRMRLVEHSTMLIESFTRHLPGGKTQSNLRVKANHNQHHSTGSIKHSGKPMLFLMANEICKGRRCPVNNVPNDPM